MALVVTRAPGHQPLSQRRVRLGRAVMKSTEPLVERRHTTTVITLEVLVMQIVKVTASLNIE
jgi:hypothetical protein